MRKNQIIILMLCALFLGCAKQEKQIGENTNSNLRTILVPNPIDTKDVDIKDVDIIDNLEYIILEAKENSFFGQVSKLRVYQDKIFVLDRRYTQTVLIYSTDGKHIATIGNNKGQGPLDFVSLSNFEIDYVNDQLIIMDNFGQKFMIYDFEGKFVKRIGSKFRVTDAVLLPNGNIIHAKSSNEHKLSGQSNSKIFILDDNQKIIKEGFEYDDNKNIIYHSYDIIRSLENGGITFAPRLRDTIYTLTIDSMVPKYVIDYGNNKKISKQTIDNIGKYDDFLALCKDGSFCFLGTHVESNDHICLLLGHAVINPTTVFYNKKTNKTVAISMINEKKLSKRELYKSPLCSDKDGYFYGAFDLTPVDEITQLFPELQYLDEQSNLNPILFKYKIKNVE
jgi:hypothetical protein